MTIWMLSRPTRANGNSPCFAATSSELHLTRHFAYGAASMNASVAHKVADILEKYRLPATPQAYELIYYCTTNAYPRLAAAIKHLLLQDRAISLDDLEKLRAQHLPNTYDAGQLGDARATFERAVTKTTGALGKALAASDTFSDQLANVRMALQPSGVATYSRESDVLAITQAMQDTVDGFRLNLREAQSDFKTLQDKLAQAHLESLTDPLTGIPNRRYFEEFMERHLADPAASAKSVSIIFSDIDHFKSINDRFGHLVGDQVLRLIATVIRHTIRENDIVARLGGEEFVVVLPDAPLSLGKSIAENIRKTVAGKTLVRRTTGEHIGNVTLSLGVAAFQSDMTSGELLKRADDCLYAAKQRGRNCVVTETELSGDNQRGHL